MPIVQDYTALLSGYSMHGTAGKSAFVTFSFPEARPLEYGNMSQWRPFTEAERELTRAVMKAIELASGLKFFEVPDQEGAIRFSVHDLAPGRAGEAYYPSVGFGAGIISDVFIDISVDKLYPQILFHEIGHALGLKHPFEGEITLDKAIDNIASTVMSYTWVASAAGEVLGPLDIAALQHLYGLESSDGTHVSAWSWDANSLTMTMTGHETSDVIAIIGARVIADGLGGDDQIEGGSRDDILRGGDGADKLNGGGGADFIQGDGDNDVIQGGNGDDTISGGEGDDDLRGGAGADEISGGDGDDAIQGGPGENSISGGGGADRVLGDSGSDKVQGDDGDDLISGFAGADSLKGGLGGDSLFGGDDADTLEGDEGNDSLSGDGGDDLLQGGADRDTIVGGAGNDRLDGGDGNDFLSGQAGNDELYGGAGDDYLFFELIGSDFISGGTGDDYIDLYPMPGAGGITIDGGDGVDRVTILMSQLESSVLEAETYLSATTNVEAVSLRGWARPLGNIILGSSYDEQIVGGDDTRSWLSGAGGNDSISGSDLSDILEGGAGDDNLWGGNGDDVLVGGSGRDNMDGGEGADLFVFMSFDDLSSGSLDWVAGFKSGIDKIDLTALGAVQISTSLSGGITMVTVTGSGRSGSFRVHSEVLMSDLLTSANVQIMATPQADSLSGTAKADVIDGLAGNDMVFLQQGGDDSVRGGSGADGLYFGAAYTFSDMIDAGQGNDTLALQGSYSTNFGLVANAEVLLLLSGQDTRFGDVSGGTYTYSLTSNDEMIAGGGVFTVQASGLKTGEHLYYDSSAEKNGNLRVFAGIGNDRLIGGDGSDGFFFDNFGNLTGADIVDGGAGTDSIALRGNYVGAQAVTFTASSMADIEVLVLLSGLTKEFGGLIDSNGFDYDVTMHDANVLAGSRMDMFGNLSALESVRFDGRAETDGYFRVFLGAGNDTVFGSQGNDLIAAGAGADQLDGSGGADTYVYRAITDSIAAFADTIVLGSGDRIDLSFIDANGNAADGNQAFAFIGAEAFGNVAGQLRAYQANGGWIVEGDVDGNGVADLVINVTTPLTITAEMFIP